MEESGRKGRVIAARERGPGPGRYALPPTVGYVNHDITKPSSPAYSLHSRLSSRMVSVDSSPGPQYHIDAKLTRFGYGGSPAYSMLGRMRRAAEALQTPGPGAYSPENAPPLIHRRPPSYTMAFRTRYRPTDSVPAPNRYTLPVMLGPHVPCKPSSASFSMSARRRAGGPAQDLSATPGPGGYNSTEPNVYLSRQPSFSMQGRRRPGAHSAACTPGPATHRPERVTAHLPRPPSYSMGVRHSEFVTPLIADVSDL